MNPRRRENHGSSRIFREMCGFGVAMLCFSHPRTYLQVLQPVTCYTVSGKIPKWRWKSQHALADAMCSWSVSILLFQVVIEGVVLTGTIKFGRHGKAVVM